MIDNGLYLYAIMNNGRGRSFGPVGIGDQGGEVYTVSHGDVSAVVSPSPVREYPVTRANTLAHQKVMEAVMACGPMLPVRFGVIGESEEPIRERVLKTRYDEFREALEGPGSKVELGLKAMWIDLQAVFAEIVAENQDIRRLRDRVTSGKGARQSDKVRLGEMVKKALEKKKERFQDDLVAAFKGHFADFRANRLFGDQVAANLAFLVAREEERAFDGLVNEVTSRFNGSVRFKYVGPVPPCNFVEIAVTW